MAMALCERLPALMLLANNNTLLTLFKWVEPFQHMSERTRVSAEHTLMDGCALSQMTLTDELKMIHLFSKCTVYNYASVSLLLAVLYLSSPGFLRASQPLHSTVASPALRPADRPAASSSSSFLLFFCIRAINSFCKLPYQR